MLAQTDSSMNGSRRFWGGGRDEPEVNFCEQAITRFDCWSVSPEVGKASGESHGQRTGVSARHWVGGQRVEVVRARSFADLRRFRMMAGFGRAGALAALFGDRRVWLRVFVSHPFRKER